MAVGVLRTLVEKVPDASARFVAARLVLPLTSSLDEHEHALAHGQELPWPSTLLQPAFARYALAPRPGVGQALSKPSRHIFLTLIRNQWANTPWVHIAVLWIHPAHLHNEELAQLCNYGIKHVCGKERHKFNLNLM